MLSVKWLKEDVICLKVFLESEELINMRENCPSSLSHLANKYLILLKLAIFALSRKFK